ncbi:xanthine dehydrogenase family protein molybdopterin-binding subunit [Sphaerisporangium sp. TRM90804]|uniref:xanthine dehydrogenase family protein molybdopterin-binding subunit n=1 Tax=Sphaerisporangium sp. TRM90804 TaxID=3031113 RepID=UPI002449E6C9|nr:xanthine dehydrogenase family protein molybdopterin-binding subunit [Sphaerisporangium sp. TRM90804]MDH2426283.1 xanthine dehydrogenase family protein molybdopterin-binding subunit [Sphaerisporangium sp. TRM90804]
MTVTGARVTGSALDRVDGPEKVTGRARYAYEHRPRDVAYAVPVQAAIARGEVVDVDVDAVLQWPGVIAAMWHGNAPRLAPSAAAELAVLQSRQVAYRGQYVAVVVAETYEQACEAARLLRVQYEERPHDVALRVDHPGMYRPDHVNPDYPTDSSLGDPEAALASAAVVVDATYATPAEHHNPMEPHAAVAVWEEGGLTVHDSTQGASGLRATIAPLFGMPPDRVRIVSPYVGGGFGSKGKAHPHVVLAALAAKQVGRPVKLAVTRQQMFAVTGYRTPTVQRVRLGADGDGRLVAITHEAFEQTSTISEFAEQTTVATRMMYAAPHRHTSHRLVRLDVPTPTWMRAPGEAPGMFALESAMDELAVACGVDPVELRVRNDPERDPESGLPFSSRNLVACLREGARRFGWHERDPRPGIRRRGRVLVGTGVASSTYPAYRVASRASARAEPDGRFTVRIAAADIGTGARTVLTQLAADALAVPPERVRVEVGDSALPKASTAGGSMGTASWGTAVVRACEALMDELARHGGAVPPPGLSAEADTAQEVRGQRKLARHAYGAQFAEVGVDVDTGEVRVLRLLGVFAAGRILNPKTARSQFIGGMTMGMSMALLEESVLDREFGDYLNHDLAQYHLATCADVRDIEAAWVEEDDPDLNPMGSKGIGEIGIVGTAAAIASAVHHATGVRVRDLPIRLDKLVG